MTAVDKLHLFSMLTCFYIENLWGIPFFGNMGIGIGIGAIIFNFSKVNMKKIKSIEIDDLQKIIYGFMLDTYPPNLLRSRSTEETHEYIQEWILDNVEVQEN